MLMYPDHLQSWLDFGHCLLSFLILVSIWLRETGQTWGFQGLSLEHMGERPKHLNCGCILTTVWTDYILVPVCWLSLLWWHFDLIKQVQFAFSGHFLDNTWEEWAESRDADVSWPPSELIRFCTWPVDFPHFIFFSCVFCSFAPILQTFEGSGVPQILDPQIDLYVSILWYSKKWQILAYENLPVTERGVSLTAV